MTARPANLQVSTPGRICLFGEHLDYLGLPVIPAAISLRLVISGMRTSGRAAVVRMPDIGQTVELRLDSDDPLPYGVERDYLRSVVNVLRREGAVFASGTDCTVHSDIPINAGTSSSSALCVSWVHYCSLLASRGPRLSPEACAGLAHQAEVVEFGEPGGMMDHYSTALGGVLWLQFHPELAMQRLHPQLSTFVLADSGEPKDTKRILDQVKRRVLGIVSRVKSADPEFSIHTAALSDLGRYREMMSGPEMDLLSGTLVNRDLTVEAKTLLTSGTPDPQQLGGLLNRHHAVLRDILGISTPKIDRMLEAALRSGAAGGKINGSGGGGCMFVYAPDRPEEVASAIEGVGGKPYIVIIDNGTRTEAGPITP